MSTMIQYIGIDVDDKNFHGCCVDGNNENNIIEFRTNPTVSAFIKKLEEISKDGYKFKLCYEATYLGFCIQREFQKKGYDCEIIAPSLIPQERSRRVKNDKIDARQLAKYYMNNLLTTIHVPDEEAEMVRDLIRSRKFIIDQLNI